MPSMYGVLYSSFSVFDNKIFLLNTTNGLNGIMIEDTDMASTFRTMYECIWQQI